MSLFKRTPPAQITDGNGHTWEPAPAPDRHGEQIYYNATAEADEMLTPSEIRHERGRARKH